MCFSRKAAALQQLAVFHAQNLLPAVTIFIIPTVEVPTKICVSKDMLYTKAFDRRIVNNDATTIISNKFLPVTTELNTSKSINKSFLNRSAVPCINSSCFLLSILRLMTPNTSYVGTGRCKYNFPGGSQAFSTIKPCF